MDRERLQEIAATSETVRVVCDMLIFESGISDRDRARLAFRVLMQRRAVAAARLRRAGRGAPLVPVVWPERDADEQAQVLRFLDADVCRLEGVLAEGIAPRAVA